MRVPVWERVRKMGPGQVVQDWEREKDWRKNQGAGLDARCVEGGGGRNCGEGQTER